MPLITVPTRADKSIVSDVIKKSKSKVKAATTVKGGGGSLLDRINQIKAMVEKNLGQYRDEYQVINNDEVLHDFITECIGNGYISIDTETDGLDPLRNILAGICPYTYGQKSAYIPLNHISYITGQKSDGQLPMDFVMSEFKRLLEKKPQIDMFNAPFDIRVLRHNGLSDIYCTWDAYLGARILNENEPQNKLKPLHQKYCLNGKGDAFTFEDLFKGIPFTKIPYNVGYLYAAHDPIITTELCDYQRKFIYFDKTCTFADRNGMNGASNVFFNIEMPIVDVVCNLEDNGVLFDFDYNAELKVKYHKLLDEREAEFHKICGQYADKIEEYRRKHPTDCKLENPINIQSTDQLAILLYDILECPLFYDKKKKKETRSTAEEQLVKLNNDVSKAILSYREFATIVSTFIDKLPECVNPDDNRIHCHFNQYGADTGRFSSSDPNLQNIPSHNKDIRKMFKASDGYILMSSDFSQQEPKCLAALCKQQCMSAQAAAQIQHAPSALILPLVCIIMALLAGFMPYPVILCGIPVPGQFIILHTNLHFFCYIFLL